MGKAVEERERGDLTEQPDRKRRKRDDDDEEGEPIIPMDVLLLIFARLTAVDLIRSGAVCVSWRSAVKMRALQFSPRTIRPWRMLCIDTEVHRWRFLDSNTGETYNIHLPELHQKRLVGMSDHGFLVYEDELSKRLSMINPITRATICFPPLPLPYRGVTQVFVVSSSSSSSPSSSRDEGTAGIGYTAVIRRANGMFSAFADARNLRTWGRVSLTLDDVSVFGLHVSGNKLCGFFRRIHRTEGMFSQFFTCDLHDPTDFRVWAFRFYSQPWSLSDFGGSFPDHESDECEDPNDCLEFCCRTFYYPVVLPNGDHIVVCRAFIDDPLHTVRVKVYRMPADLHGEAEVATSIGNCALFLDGHHSMVLSTRELPELKAGTIYFNDDCGPVDNPGVSWSSVKRGLVMFDLEAQHIVEYCPAAMTMRDCGWSRWFTPAF